MKILIISIAFIMICSGGSSAAFAQETSRFPSNTAMEFTGTVAGQPVLVELTETENGLNGRYKYLKIGAIISLEGVIDPQHHNAIELAEGKQAGSKPRPTWRAVYRNDSIIGKWYSGEHRKTYAIALTKKMIEKLPVSFKKLKRDTVVYSNPKDTTLPAFTYHNSILQAEGNKELSQWLNAELMKIYPSYKSPNAIEKNMSKDMKDHILVYIESVADAGYPENVSWNWDYENAQYENYHGQGYLTIYTSGYEFSGGAHGNSWEVYENYDIRNKKKLPLSAIIHIDSTKISALLEKKFRQDYEVEEGKSLTEFGLFENKIKPNNNFYFDDWGMTFVYNQYEIGPYALGIIALFIPWEKLQPYLDRTFSHRMGLIYK